MNDTDRCSTAHIALGSNVGDRAQALNAALAMLREGREVEVVAVSPIFETLPVGPPGQGLYLNAAATLRTSLSPWALLEAMLAIEKALGRDRTREQPCGPRRIDLDLLLYDERMIDEPGLHVPHPRMHEREFVLQPLACIAPRAVHPRLGMTVAALLSQLGGGGAPEAAVVSLHSPAPRGP